MMGRKRIGQGQLILTVQEGQAVAVREPIGEKREMNSDIAIHVGRLCPKHSHYLHIQTDQKNDQCYHVVKK